MNDFEAYLATTERLARAATPGPWHVKEIDGRSVMSESRMVVAAVAAREQWPITEDAQHIARHDPAWALRWVAAVREILAIHAPKTESPPSPGALVCTGCPTPAWGDPRPWPCPTVLALMSVYGDREEGS